MFLSNGNLINGDCLEVMRDIPDGSVDMILTDPPYGTTACKWDVVIPFEPMWDQIKRVIKPNGAIVLTATQPFTSVLVSSNLKMFKYEWVWCKNKVTDFLRAKLKPMTGHENVLVFSKGSVANGAKNNMDYFPQGLIEINKTQKNAKIGEAIAGRNKSNYGPNNVLHNETYVQKFKGYPNTKLDFNSETDAIHPTQKPVALFEYLIKTYTQPGEVVLDFTIGSGTTAIAAENLNRQWIGIEKDLIYYLKAVERIYKHVNK